MVMSGAASTNTVNPILRIVTRGRATLDDALKATT
jgi:hypothetical protein